MQTVSISFFRFKGLANHLWAFSQMQFARGPLSKVPGIGFHKLMGTGTGQGFTPIPNFSVYAVLATWPSMEHAKEQIKTASVFERYRQHSAENFTVYVKAYRSRGEWDGIAPFEVEEEPDNPSPLGILTRATIKPSSLVAFWKRAPAISVDVGEQDQIMFKIGMGEVPWFHQVTFSIWEDANAATQFAYRNPAHRDAAKDAMDKNWFSEYLFARFVVLGSEGQWGGKDPMTDGVPELIAAE